MKLQWIQARLNLWRPRWTADPPAVDKTSHHGHRRLMSSHPTRGTMWIVFGEVDRGKELRRKSVSGACCFFPRLDLLIISVTPGHTEPTCRSLLCAHRPSIMLLSSLLLFTCSHLLAPLFLWYLPHVSAQKPGSRVSAYLCATLCF